MSVVAVALIVAETSGEKSIKPAPKNFYFHPSAKLHCFCNLDLKLNKDLKGEIHQVAAKKSRPPLFSSQESNKSKLV